MLYNVGAKTAGKIQHVLSRIKLCRVGHAATHYLLGNVTTYVLHAERTYELINGASGLSDVTFK